MIIPHTLCPAPPSWSLDWDAVLDACPWLAPLAECPQEPLWHGEGDVLVHTRMVCEALTTMEAWRGLDDDDRQLAFQAALTHDLGKPASTRPDAEGRLNAPGHSRRGAVMVRRLLMEPPRGMAPPRREALAGLVARHGLPLWSIERDDGQYRALGASLALRCDLLATLAEADVRGRVSDDAEDLLCRVELFRELCRENRCLDRPAAFPSDHTRFVYFRSGGRRLPDVEAHDDTWGTVTIMVGLPGAGKDHWIRHNLPDQPMISLDAIRRELGVRHHKKKQGRVVQEARRRARELLRAEQPFVWNATNLARDLRAALVELLASYRARIRMVYIEPELEVLLHQNRDRRDVVPEQVLYKMAGRLRVPDLTEAHEVTYVW